MEYTVLVVDDEEEIRRGIVDSVDWPEWGFRVVGEVANGNEALAFLERQQPDVILSDIRMPGLDGVGLMRHVHAHFPAIRMVILSGFSDFEYMKESISNDVVSYLLKPTDLVEFEKTFRELHGKLEQQRAAQDEEKRRESFVREGSAHARARVYARLIQGDANAMKEADGWTEAGWLPGGCRVCIVSMHYSAEYLALVSDKDKLWLKEQIVLLLQKQMKDASVCTGEAFLNEQKIVTAFADGSQKAVARFCADAIQLVRQRLGIPVHVGVGGQTAGTAGLALSYNQARAALDMPGEETSFFEDGPDGAGGAPCGAMPDVSYPDETVLTSIILSGSHQRIMRSVDEHFRQLEPLRCPDYSQVDTVIMKYILRVSDCAGRLGIDLPRLAAEGNVRFEMIYEIESLLGKRHFILYLWGLLEKAAAEKRKFSANDRLLADIREYVDSHFCLEQFSLNTVADAVQKSPAYVSRFFKDTVGVNFIDYVRKKRIERALELLREGQMKVYEVSRAVGYGNVSYFMRTFKKYYGVTPSDYQQLEGAPEHPAQPQEAPHEP